MNRRRTWFLILGIVIVLLLGVILYFHFLPYELAIDPVKRPRTEGNAPVINLNSSSPQFQHGTATDLSYRYDARGQIQAILYPGGSAYTYMYNANGDKIRETSPSGRTWIYTYDQSNHPLTVMDPDGHITSYKVPSGESK